MMCSLYGTLHREDINKFIEQDNRHHPTNKFTAEISDKEITFLVKCVQSIRAKDLRENILDVRTHFKPTEKFQYTHFNSCHLPGSGKVLSKKKP